VANSARSQLAEGIAKHLAPEFVQISSAGSHPTSLRPEVSTVLAEVGISASGQYSKGLTEIDLDTVDAVITLCADEVCPVFPRDVLRFHWGLPDPVTKTAPETNPLQGFREVRDELQRRLHVLFEKRERN
jgi:protein-tyrosine-phosphatase